MFLITGVCTSPDSTWSPEHRLLEHKIEIQEVKERDISVFCQCYLGLLDGRVASASWSPFFEDPFREGRARKKAEWAERSRKGKGLALDTLWA